MEPSLSATPSLPFPCLERQAKESQDGSTASRGLGFQGMESLLRCQGHTWLQSVTLAHQRQPQANLHGTRYTITTYISTPSHKQICARSQRCSCSHRQPHLCIHSLTCTPVQVHTRLASCHTHSYHMHTYISMHKTHTFTHMHVQKHIHTCM